MIGTFLEILILLLVANGAPVLAARVLGSRWETPVDHGMRLPDGTPLLGGSKTWRGVLAIMAAAILGAAVLNFGIAFGAVFGVLVVAGDLLSSFLKRRRGLAPSSRSTGLDQLPEALLPAAFAVTYLDIEWWWAPLWAGTFMLLDILVSPLLYRLRIRKNPY